MLRVLMGLQSAKGTPATEFYVLNVVSSDLSYGLTEVNSKALTGVEWSKEGVTSVGTLGGNTVAEMTRATLMLLLEAGGFDKDDVTEDSILKAPAAATYKHVTIIQEFVDEQGKGHYDTYVDCIINTLSLSLVTDAHVEGTITPIGLKKGETTAGVFAGTIVDDTERILYNESSIIQFDGSEQRCQVNTFGIELNNNLSTEKVLCGDYILQKGDNRTIDVSTSVSRLLSDDYIAEFEKAKNGTGIVAAITLKNLDNDEVKIDLPKITYTELKRGDMTKNGSTSKKLTAKWDDTAGTVGTFTFKGLGKA